MKLREVLNYICNAVDRKDLVEGITATNSPMQYPDLGYIYSLLDGQLYKIAQSEFYTDTEEIKTIDKKIYDSFLSSDVFDILNVTQNGVDVKFTREQGYIVLDKDGEYEVEYRTYPKLKQLNLDEDYPDRANNMLFNAIFATVAEYKDNDIKL